MNQQPQGIEIAGPKHAAPVRRRRRVGASAGALLSGAALVFGLTGVADAAVHTPINHGTTQLTDNCATGFKGSVTWTNGAAQDTITVKFTPVAGYDSAGVDVRGDVKVTDSTGRVTTRVIRLKRDVEPLTLGLKTVTFKAPANVLIWRVGVTAIPTANPLTDVHALDYEAGPCE